MRRRPRSVDGRCSLPPPAVRLGPELPLKLCEAPDSGAVRAEVGLDVGGRLIDGGQVDAEQLCAPLQRRCDRPAQVWVVPSPHRDSLANRCSTQHSTHRARRGYRGHGGTVPKVVNGTVLGLVVATYGRPAGGSDILVQTRGAHCWRRGAPDAAQ
jgi:hypothetical protein